MENILILILFSLGFLCGQAKSSCPFSDPDCHPLCIEYIRECKYCRCKVSSSGSRSSSSDKFGGSGSSSSDKYGGSGSGSSDKWNSKHGDNSNSFGGGYTDNSGSNSGGNTENTKVIIIHEKGTQTQQLAALPGLPMVGSMAGHMPFNIPHGPMTAQNPFSHLTSSSGRRHSMNVPLKSPGIPKYCISVDKMDFEDCPCTVVDEGGCLTCPCYSASKFWIAVRQKESHEKPKPKHNECIGTTLCMMSCKGGYHLGETGSDGCQSCTCLKREQKQTQNNEKTCLKLYECIIKCSERKLGFTVGEETSDGCRSCKCEEKNSGDSEGKTNNGGSGSMMKMFGNTNGGNNVLKSPDKGVGTSGGNESKAKCNPPMVMCTNDGNNLMQTMSGGSGGSGGSGSSSGGSGSGVMNSGSGDSGPFNPMGGGSGSGGGMKSPFGSSSGGSGSGSGMKSPFGNGGPGAGTGGGPGMGGMGPHGPSNPGFPSKKKVEQTAYNENCFGPSCSAKDGGLVEGTLENDLIMGRFRK